MMPAITLRGPYRRKPRLTPLRAVVTVALWLAEAVALAFVCAVLLGWAGVCG